MFPYSEFIQAKIYRENGLSETGKFNNDFRLTEYGKIFREYWIDEIPQIFNWLKGDLKICGLRPMTRHYLSLFPKDFQEIYLKTKPGLIPPIYSESTNGIEDIIKTSNEYLNSYQNSPLRTDLKYMIKTLIDIVFFGVRSK